MAGDWIKVETTTPDKPEVFAMADALCIDPDAVVGKLLRVWVWADLQTRDGRASVSRSERDVGVTVSLLDRVSGTPGFADAMLECGWLERSDDGLRFANFDRHNGNPAKKRATATQRKQRERSGTSRTERDKGVTREEKRRVTPVVPKGTETKPEDLFQLFWNVVHRKEARGKAETAFQKAVDRVASRDGSSKQEASAWIAERMRIFASSPQSKDDIKGKLHPATWLNQSRYDDDDEVWGIAKLSPAQQPLSRRRDRA